MPIAQLTDVQQYQGQTITNVYYYRVGGTINTTLLEELLDEFETAMLPLIADLQHSSLEHIRLDALEVEGVNFASQNVNVIGSNGDEPLSSFYALGFKLQRGNRTTKSGAKRIGGISESWVSGNVVVTDPFIDAAIAAYADALDDPLIGTSATWTPVIVKFDPNNPGVVLAEQLVVGGAFLRVTTQNTRKAE